MDNPTFHPRKLARRMAKASLDANKATGYNKRRKHGNVVVPSYFCRNWKNIAAGVAEKGKLK